MLDKIVYVSDGFDLLDYGYTLPSDAVPNISLKRPVAPLPLFYTKFYLMKSIETSKIHSFGNLSLFLDIKLARDRLPVIQPIIPSKLWEKSD